MSQPEREVERIELITPMLGLSPFTLIELGEHSDGSGDPSLTVRFGGGADNCLMMPLLVLTEAPPEGNPLAEMLREMWLSPDTDQDTVEAVTRQFNPDWIAYVRGA